MIAYTFLFGIVLGIMIAPYVFSLIHKIERYVEDKRRVVEKPLMLAIRDSGSDPVSRPRRAAPEPYSPPNGYGTLDKYDFED